MNPVDASLDRLDDGHSLLSWTLEAGARAVSSAPVGGGLTAEPSWVLNIGVAPDFARTDLGGVAAEHATRLGLTGTGLALFTAAAVERNQRAEVDGVTVDATVGIGKPTWAADSSGGWNDYSPGTINVVVQVRAPLTDAALVNAVVTATEAKTQAMIEAGVPGTGTASDAVVIIAPDPAHSVEDAALFAGPRSRWGAPLAQAVHHAVRAGIEAAGA